MDVIARYRGHLWFMRRFGVRKWARYERARHSGVTIDYSAILSADVPEPEPGESITAYRARVSEHVGATLDATLAHLAEAGQQPPDWLAAVAILRARKRPMRRFLGSPLRQPPEDAHGYTFGGGGFFSVWGCPNGHHAIGEPAVPPTHVCQCGASWTICPRDEAHAFIVEIEGHDRAHDGIAFRLL